MGGRKAKAKPRTVEPTMLIVGWAPVFPDQKEAFPASTYSGARLRDLLGTPPETFARVINLNERPIREDDFDRGISLPQRRRAIEILQQNLGLPVLVIGRQTARAFGLDSYLGAAGYLQWFAGATGRQYAVVPGPSDRNRWWQRKENYEAARLFLRGVAGGTAESMPFPGGNTDAIDLDELEHVREVWGAPTVKEVAAHFKVSERTLYRRLEDPEFRDAWERGGARACARLRQASFKNAIYGGKEGMGDPGMQKHLRQTMLGERIDEAPKFPALGVGGGEGDDEVLVITRGKLREVIRRLNAKYQIESDIDDAEILPALPAGGDLSDGEQR